MSHHATGVSVAILPPMKWTLSKPDHLESITFDFKHAGTRIKVHTRHMVLINIQSLPVKTADTWETDQSFSGRSMVEGATIKSCEEHSILMYRGASVPGTFRNVLQIGKGGLLIMDSVVVCLFFKTQKSFPWKHNQKNEKIKQKKTSQESTEIDILMVTFKETPPLLMNQSGRSTVPDTGSLRPDLQVSHSQPLRGGGSEGERHWLCLCISWRGFSN